MRLSSIACNVTGITAAAGLSLSVLLPAMTTAGDAQLPAADTVRIPPLRIPYIPLPRPPAPQAERGLEFRLVEVSPAAVAPAAAELRSEPLPRESAAQLLARLPALPDTTPPSFRFPPASPPAPRTGVTVTTAFPPDSAVSARPPAAASEPLEVVRIVPAGDTELAPHLTIVFNQPMVPLATVTGTVSHRPPVRLSPEPPGRWSWLDTRTLRFEPTRRFAMATEYEVAVPAGTRSAAGQALGDTVRIRFATPAPRALGAYPALAVDTARQRVPARVRDGFQPLPAWSTTLQPVILIVFDQRIAAAAVLSATRLLASGQPQPLRLATPAEVAADTVVAALAEDAEPGRWIALRPAAPLPRAADIRVVVEAGGAVSAEGTRATTAAQELRFRTHGPLDVVSHDCGERNPCRPGTPWTIRFTNPLDSTGSAQPQLRVEPALPALQVRVVGTDLQIMGQASPNTRYQLRLESGVRDRFGQSLARGRTLTFAVGPAEPALALQGAPLVVLDPTGPPRVRLQSQGHHSVDVRIYRVTPEQWPQYASAVQRWYELGTFDAPGQRIVSERVSIPDGAGFAETTIDVGAALDEGLGHAVVVIEPTAARGVLRPGRERRRNLAFAWVQATRIGITAAVSSTEVAGWATSLGTGEPLPGVELRLLPSGRRALTGSDGVAVVELGDSGDVALVASRGSDTALLPENAYGYGRAAGWRQRTGSGVLRWLVLSDRGLYRPGETAHVKGWVRQLSPGRGGDLMLPADISSIAFRLRGPRGEELGTGELQPGALGGFDTALDLPEAVNLGHAMLELEPRGVPDAAHQAAHLALRLQEFRRPDYEVALEADPGPHVAGDVVALALTAKYFGGGGLGGAQVDWRAHPAPTFYAPPGWNRWHFGRARSGGYARRAAARRST